VYRSLFWTDLHQIWFADSPYDGIVAQHYTSGKIPDGGSHYVWFGFLASGEDICIKFGTRLDNGHIKVTVAQYSTFTKIQDGGARHHGFGFEEWMSKDIWVKFGVHIDIGRRRGSAMPKMTLLVRFNMQAAVVLHLYLRPCLGCQWRHLRRIWYAHRYRVAQKVSCWF